MKIVLVVSIAAAVVVAVRVVSIAAVVVVRFVTDVLADCMTVVLRCALELVWA